MDANIDRNMYPFWLDSDTPELTDDEKRNIIKDAKWDMVIANRDILRLYQDGQNKLWLGWLRRGRRVIFAQVHLEHQLIVCCIMRVEPDTGSPWRSDTVYERIGEFRLVVPLGVT